MSRTVNKYDLNNGKVLEITNYEMLEGVVFEKIYMSNVEFSEGTEFVVNVEDSCHYIPEKKELTCGDCSRLNEDTGCFACQETDSAMYNGHLCIGFIDKRDEEFNSILMFWKVQGLYDREKINKLLDDFEQSYDRLFNQE